MTMLTIEGVNLIDIQQMFQDQAILRGRAINTFFHQQMISHGAYAMWSDSINIKQLKTILYSELMTNMLHLVNETIF